LLQRELELKPYSGGKIYTELLIETANRFVSVTYALRGQFAPQWLNITKTHIWQKRSFRHSESNIYRVTHIQQEEY